MPERVFLRVDFAMTLRGRFSDRLVERGRGLSFESGGGLNDAASLVIETAELLP